MGSLMAGWNSPVLKSKPDVCKRNRSLTKEEIEAFWRAKKKSDSITLEVSQVDESGRKFQKSSFFPIARAKDSHTKTSAHKIINNNGWWTMSNSAFLNEPPVSSEGSNIYESQFHVASRAPKSNSKDDEISST